MALPQGVNLRATLSYVTDGADEQFANSSTLYPVPSAQGNDIGWEITPGGTGRDRSTSVDVRLAGMAFTSTLKRFKIKLPSAGDYLIRIAAGDMGSSNPTYVELFDDTSSLAVLSSGSIIVGNFKDATNVTHTAANWPANNNSVIHTFTTDKCVFEIGGSISGNDVLAHVYVEAVAAGGATIPIMAHHYRQQRKASCG